MDWKPMIPQLAGMLIAQLVFFILVVVVLRKLLLSDTMKAVDTMKRAESDLAKKEATMSSKMELHEQDMLRSKAEAEEELERQREASEQDLSRMKERMRSEAQVEADKIISEAQLNKDKLREQLVRETAGKAVDFAGDLFKLIIGKSVNDKLNAAFVDELIMALEEVDETAIHVEADEAEFIASHTLASEQKARLEKLLNEKFSVDLKINEKVDENLLGGLIIKLGSLEIDGSVLNRFNEGVEQIKKTV